MKLKMMIHKCPHCLTEHNNIEFAPHCDIDCVISARKQYDKNIKYFEREQKEKT